MKENRKKNRLLILQNIIVLQLLFFPRFSFRTATNSNLIFHSIVLRLIVAHLFSLKKNSKKKSHIIQRNIETNNTSDVSFLLSQ